MVRQTMQTSTVVKLIMMTSWHDNIFHITGPLWGESTSHWWIPTQKGSVMGSFYVSIVNWKSELLVIWNPYRKWQDYVYVKWEYHSTM